MPSANCWVQGAVAQLGERLVCNQEATGSIPVSSTKLSFEYRVPCTEFAELGTRYCVLETGRSPTLGVKTTTDSVSRFKKVAWRRTLGWKEAVSYQLTALRGFLKAES